MLVVDLDLSAGFDRVVYEPVCYAEEFFDVLVVVVVDVQAQVVEVVPFGVFDTADVLYISDA